MISRKVSIIIPAYNAESCLGRAIDSALGQTHRDIEVIVVDDGSRDGTSQVANRYGSCVRVVRTHNRGGCAARNEGLRLARGDFIQYLDADDELCPGKVEECLAVFTDERTIPYTKWLSRASDVSVGDLYCRSRHVDDSLEAVLSGFICTPAPLYPIASVRKVGGWREGLACAQDFEFNLRLAVAGFGFKIVDKQMITVHRRSGSVSGNMRNVVEIFFHSAIAALAELSIAKRLTDTRKQVLSGFFARTARKLYRVGMKDEARTAINLSRALAGTFGLRQAYSAPLALIFQVFGIGFAETLTSLKREISVPKKSSSSRGAARA